MVLRTPHFGADVGQFAAIRRRGDGSRVELVDPRARPELGLSGKLKHCCRVEGGRFETVFVHAIILPAARRPLPC
jgi:hypothetical protein